MIIKGIERNKFIFWKDRFRLSSDEKSASISLERNTADKIKGKLKDFKVESVESFKKLKLDLADISDKEYSIIEAGILKCIDKPWKLFDKEAKQVPRPLSVVINKKEGIKEFLVLSPNSENFEAAVNANKMIEQEINKKTKTEYKNEEEALMSVKEAADEVFKEIDFEIRIGVAFNNYNNGKYLYKDKELTREEQIEYVRKLIETYNLIYVENPFFEDDIESYTMLCNEVRSKCFVCLNSKINEYTRHSGERAINAAVLKFSNITQFFSDAEQLKNNGLIIVADTKSEAPDIIISSAIPIVKLYNIPEYSGVIERLKEINSEILEEKR